MLRLYNTMTRLAEPLDPLEAGHVRMYTCGPTVYNFAHIGNFRAYIFEDILRRYVKFSGFRVTQVMNLTDVDDKTIRGAIAKGITLDAYTRTYKDAFFADLDALHIERAEHYPAATDYIPAMIALIERIMANGHAYRSEDGSVYFDVSSFPAYGRLAHLDLDQLRAGARVAQDEYDKESVADFALWKAWAPDDGDVAWDSPWGRGRPGWHIECSAMSTRLLGDSFDIHTGGADNIFPHHENEIAQTESATGKPYVRCWLHCGYLVVDGAKMSKSLGNFHTLRDLLARGYTGREVRYVLLAAHYRAPLNFTFAALDAARAALARVDDFVARLTRRAGGTAADPAACPAWAQAGRAGFVAAMDDDLGMPGALGAVFDLIHAGNRALDAGEVTAPAAATVLQVVDGLDAVLGVLRAWDRADGPGAPVQELVRQRQAARAARNWAEADRVRDQLAALGWAVRDTPDGPELKRL